MPSWVVPSDSHAVGDAGHTTDHNHVADDLTLIATAFSGVTTGSASTSHNTLDDGSGNMSVAGGLTVNGQILNQVTGNSAVAVIKGNDDGSQYSDFQLADLASGNYWSFSHRSGSPFTHYFVMFYQSLGTFIYPLLISPSGAVITGGGGGGTGNNTLDDGSGNMSVIGNLDIATAGKGLQVKEGSNAKQGTATLNGTTAVVVANTSVTANSRIFLTIQSPGGTPASPYVSARSAGTSFSIKSTGASDTSTVAYFITEPG